MNNCVLLCVLMSFRITSVIRRTLIAVNTNLGSCCSASKVCPIYSYRCRVGSPISLVFAKPDATVLYTHRAIVERLCSLSSQHTTYPYMTNLDCRIRALTSRSQVLLTGSVRAASQDDDPTADHSGLSTGTIYFQLWELLIVQASARLLKAADIPVGIGTRLVQLCRRLELKPK